jgi:hypothetical protein
LTLPDHPALATRGRIAGLVKAAEVAYKVCAAIPVENFVDGIPNECSWLNPISSDSSQGSDVIRKQIL